VPLNSVSINTEPSRDGEHHRNRARPITAADLLGGAMTCFCEVTTDLGPGGDVVVLRVAGEIDMLSLAVLRDALGAAMARQPTDLVVDLAGVVFCCVRGFVLLAGGARAAQSSGISYALSGLTPYLERIATLIEPEPGCVRYRSVAAAVSAIRVDHTYRPDRF